MKTQKEIANILGISQGAVSKFLTAKMSPTMKTAKKLKEIFGFPYEIWGDKEKIQAWIAKQTKKATNAKRG